MAHRTNAHALSAPLRQVFVSEEAAAAACKVLHMLAAGRTGPESADEPQEPAGGSADRTQMRKRAREAIALRERRFEAFPFSAEAPFVMLVALYINEEWEPAVTQTRLCQLAWLSNSTALRWLETLTFEGLVKRTTDPVDGRKVLLSLSPEARAKLDDLFAAPASSSG